MLFCCACGLQLKPIGVPTQGASTLTAQALIPSGTSAGTPAAEESATLSLAQTNALPQGDPLTSTQAVTAGPTLTAWRNNTPTPGSSPTPSRTPTRTAFPTRTFAPSASPTITDTPEPTATPTPPAPDNWLVRPGPLSKVVSPIKTELYALTGDRGMVNIELIGEDGRIITRHPLGYDRDGRAIYVLPEIPFQINTVSEFARLQVHTEDAYGRTTALFSVELILLSVGREDITPPAFNQDPYLIRSPRSDESISGGKFTVEGRAHPVNESPVLVELIVESGKVIAHSEVNVPPPAAGQTHTPFQVDMTYQVTQKTPALLVIRQEGSRIPGTVELTSRPVILLP